MNTLLEITTLALVLLATSSSTLFAQDLQGGSVETQVQQGLSLLKEKRYSEARSKLQKAKEELQKRLGESGETKDLTKLQLVTRLIRVAETMAKAKSEVAPESLIQWNRFRGPNGSGLHPTAKIPTEWSNTKNLQWKVELPGPGASSPIIWGDKVFVTCYTGFGVDPENPGDMDDLKYHLLCFDRRSGRETWKATVKSKADVRKMRGPGIGSHGYASNTPTTDGESVFAFFGTSGVFAFDMTGNQLWEQGVGLGATEGFGSASSLVVTGELVLANAKIESGRLVALNKFDGKQLWSSEEVGRYSTPLVIDAGGRQQIVVDGGNRIVSLNPRNGQSNWTVEPKSNARYFAEKLVEFDGAVSNSSIAVLHDRQLSQRSRIIWESGRKSAIITPVVVDGKLISFQRDMMNCIDGPTGDELFRKRLADPDSSRSKRNRNINFHASPVVAGNKLISLSLSGTAYIFSATGSFEQIALNKLTEDNPVFNATPALSDNQLFIRSNKYLYCISEQN